MYAEDSFHTLSLASQIGLVVLSLLLAGLLIFASWRLALRRRLAARIAFAVLLLFLFVWLSPQVYYLYYLALFDGLGPDVGLRSGIASGCSFTVQSLLYIIAGHTLHHERVLRERYLTAG